MAELDLAAIEAREQVATKGPWRVGNPLRVAGLIFNENRERVARDQATHCAYCHLGPPEWTQRRNINGVMMPAHGHRMALADEPEHTIATDEGEYIAGNYDYEDGGIIRPEDTVFIAHARSDVPALLAEVKQLRADREVLYRYSLGVSAFARSLMEKPEAVVEHLTEHTDAKAMIVAQKGQLDVSEMLAAGWVLDDRVDYVAGKRIRFLRPPAPGTYEMDGGDQS